MKLANGILGITLALALSGLSARGQTAPDAAKPVADTFQTFYLANASQPADALEVVTALRNLLERDTKIYLVPWQNAIVIKAAPDQLVLARKLLNDIDRPKKTYRLTYTFTEIEDGKRVGTQHFAMIVVSGQRTVLKQGSKVPVVTGAYNPGTTSQNTQMTYMDVGLNLDATLDEFVNGVRLQSNVEQSSVADERSGVGPQDPVVRQTVLKGTSFLTPGKPMMLGSLDIPGSTRHLDVEVVMEQMSQ